MGPRWRKAWLIRGTGRRTDRKGFWVEWREGGKRRKRPFPTRAIAEKAKELVEADLNSWSRPAQQMPWALVRERFESTLSDVGRSHARGVKLTMRLVTERLKPSGPADLTTTALREFLSKLGATDATRAKHIRHLSAFSHWCEDEGFMPENPMRGIRQPRLMRKILRVPKPDSWVGLLRATADFWVALSDRQAWYLFILLGAVTGFRQGTLLALRRESFEFHGRVGIVIGKERKTRQEEFRALPPVVAAMVKQRLPHIADAFFPWRLWQKKEWHAIRDKAGFTHTFHDLRRASGTTWAIARLRAAGAQHLGHSGPAVFAAHYGDDAQIAIEAARMMKLPKLPPLPKYQTPTIRELPSRQTG